MQQNWTGSFDSVELKRICAPHRFSKDMGKIVGEHTGAHYFTIGQRKGLGVGGHAEPLFIVETDTQENLVFVAEGEGHAALNRFGLFVPISDVHWVREDLRMKPEENHSFMGRIRYRQPLTKCTLAMKEEGLYIVFDEPQKGIARGQFVAWYDGEELLGSGVIS